MSEKEDLFAEIQLELNATKLRQFMIDPTNLEIINKRVNELQAPFKNLNFLAKLDIVTQSAVAMMLHDEERDHKATSLIFSFHLGYSVRLLEEDKLC